jgi:hypothetical protein
MSDQTDPHGERTITSDRDTVKGLAGDQDAVPVRCTGLEGASHDLRLIPEEETGEEHDRFDWDEFVDAVERDGAAIVVHGSGQDRSLRVVDRDEAVRGTPLSTEELEESLRAGEIVSTEVTDSRVLQETVVEHADLESERIDTQAVEESVVDAELVSREVLDCDVTATSETDEGSVPDSDMFTVGSGNSSALDIGVEVEVREQWFVVTEAVEQATIESRVVDTDVSGSQPTETGTVGTEVELADIERTVLESDLLESGDVDRMDERSISSHYTEGDAIITEVLERKTVEEDVTVDRWLSGTIDDAETTDVTSANRVVIECEMTQPDEHRVGAVDGSGAGGIDRGESASTEQAESTSTDTGTTSTSEKRVISRDGDKGKTVVDASGEELGLVDDVNGDTLHVNPHPSLTEKIMAKLGWGDGDEERYPVDQGHIDEITDDHVRVSVD